MKSYLTLTLVVFVLCSCNENSTTGNSPVRDMQELTAAIANAVAGEEIILSNGIWQDAQINFFGVGTADQPITLRAETAGKVFLEGKSYVHLGGKHLVVEGLYFRNGYSPASSIFRYKIGQDTTAFDCRITSCVIENFTKPSRLTNDHWIEFFGKNNQLDHCYITGKSNDGETLRVFQDGNKNTSNHHQIVHNYFGPRPRKGGPRAETIRVGDSKTHMTPGFVNVSDNFFEGCNGEVEIISDKTNFNSFTNNIFYKCEGSLVLRHGSFATVDGNIFIGGDESDFYGGIRVINTGHWITNNYFYKINGEQFRSPLAVMNGIPKSQLNRYRQVTDAVIAYNTWVDCKSPWQIGVGQNISSADVLPEVEIRSAPPIRSIIANNLIYNHVTDPSPVVNHDDIDGISFHNNVLHNDEQDFIEFNALQLQQIDLTQVNDWLFVPTGGQEKVLGEVYNGFEFDKIETDLVGNSRSNHQQIGAIAQSSTAADFDIDKKKYGPSWYDVDGDARQPVTFQASSEPGELALKIGEAEPGDIIELTDELYEIKTSLTIDKEITIQAANPDRKAQLVFAGAENAPAFEMNPYGHIRLNNLTIKSTTDQMAFTPLNQNMSAAYKLSINHCDLSEFSCILTASKGSFADSITIQNSTIQDCASGIILAAEEKGDYNAEMVTIRNCEFRNVQKDVINFYRGGYDESTIGGYLRIFDSSFEDCGREEATGTLLKTRGIINVEISENSFRNNPVKLIALLWGEKNNHHDDNVIVNSGQIKVEEQLKLDILY